MTRLQRQILARLGWVLEDIEADEKVRLDMGTWGLIRNGDTRAIFDCDDEELDKEWDKPHCGTAACFAGWVSISPYMREIGAPKAPFDVPYWLVEKFTDLDFGYVYEHLFHYSLDRNTKAETIALLRERLAEFKRVVGYEA